LYTPVIPFYSGGRRITSLKPAQAKLGKPYLKNKIEAKGLGAWLNGKSSYLACLGSISNTTKNKKIKK
jgi:hypothetical protein